MTARVERSTDAAWFNTLLNHPDVFPWVAGELPAPLDATALVMNPRNILLRAGDAGAFLFQYHEAGTYEVHTQFFPNGRGQDTLAAVHAAAHYMFTRTECVEVFTKVPHGNRAAQALAQATGFTHLFTGGKWLLNGAHVPIDHYRIGIEEWMANAPGLIKRGQWFHEELTRQGAHATHDDDDVHDRYVGATVEMLLAHQVGKGLCYYNRWARFYGYQTIERVGRGPDVLIDIRDALLRVRDATFEVVNRGDDGCQRAQQ